MAVEIRQPVQVTQIQIKETNFVLCVLGQAIQLKTAQVVRVKERDLIASIVRRWATPSMNAHMGGSPYLANTAEMWGTLTRIVHLRRPERDEWRSESPSRMKKLGCLGRPAFLSLPPVPRKGIPTWKRSLERNPRRFYDDK